MRVLSPESDLELRLIFQTRRDGAGGLRGGHRFKRPTLKPAVVDVGRKSSSDDPGAQETLPMTTALPGE